MAISVYENPMIDLAQAKRFAEDLLDADGRQRAWETITKWPEYRRTPLVTRPDLADKTGVGSLYIKDESQRSMLKSFKSLGGAYAVGLAYERWKEAGAKGEFIVSCVSDGNHGLSVAWGARSLGIKCVIYLPTVVSPERANSILAQGAEVRRIDGNYDEVTRIHAEDANTFGWTIVTDTESEPGVKNPAVVDVMQGYGVLARELVEDLQGITPTHVIMQAGCGGLVGSILPELMDSLPNTDFVIVEPERAACLQESAKAGRPTVVTGDLDTKMVGLSVGEISLPAWGIIQPAVRYYISIDDAHVEEAMSLALHTEQHTPIEAGETGLAGLVALLGISGDEDLRQKLKIDGDSTVVLINTEGITGTTQAPETSAQVAGVN